MNSLRSDTEQRHHHEPEVIIGCHVDTITRRTGVLVWTSTQCTTGIGRFSLYGRYEQALIGTHCDIEVQVIGCCNGFVTDVPQEETKYHSGGFIFDGWNPGGVHFVVVTAVPSIHGHTIICGV